LPVLVRVLSNLLIVK